MKKAGVDINHTSRKQFSTLSPACEHSDLGIAVPRIPIVPLQLLQLFACLGFLVEEQSVPVIADDPTRGSVTMSNQDTVAGFACRVLGGNSVRCFAHSRSFFRTVIVRAEEGISPLQRADL